MGQVDYSFGVRWDIQDEGILSMREFDHRHKSKHLKYL